MSNSWLTFQALIYVYVVKNLLVENNTQARKYRNWGSPIGGDEKYYLLEYNAV
jgi:hypothetical protein